MLYADDLVLTAESRAEVLERFDCCMDAMESKGLRVNLEKKRVLVSGKICDTVVSSGEYQCGVCGRGVGGNSVLCTVCGKWTHHRCSDCKMSTKHESLTLFVPLVHVARIFRLSRQRTSARSDGDRSSGPG